MFDPQLWGSWLEYRFPQNPVFVDSRIEVFGSEVWHDYDQVSGAAQGWQGILERWDIAFVVASRAQQGNLIPAIRSDPGWTLVYEDKEGLVFVRSDRQA